MTVREKDDPRILRTPDDLGEEEEIERVSRGNWRWWWIWPVIIALGFWWAGWGWGSTGGWWFGRMHSQNTAIPAPVGSRTTETLANAGAKQPPTNATLGGSPQKMVGPGVPVLAAQDKKAYIGKQFAANEIPVQQKVSSNALWIGENKPMLAVVSGSGHDSAKGVDQGVLVDAIGTVKKAPPKAEAKRQWALSDDDASRLENQGAYIEVSQLTSQPE